MIALYHLFSGTPLARAPAGGAGPRRERTASRSCRTSGALCSSGTKLSPGQPDGQGRRHRGRTLWGELAWQLGGADGFALVAEADRTSTNPGDALRELLAALRALPDPDRRVGRLRPPALRRRHLPGGTFDTQFSFAQALTEAARADAGRAARRVDPRVRDRRTARRSARTSRSAAPAAGRRCGGCATSSGAWSRRGGRRRPRRASRSSVADCSSRSTPIAVPAPRRDRARVRRASIARQRAEFPTECREPAYVDRIKRAYPIHPELFARLYEDWSTLERFQRTRGVLRLMAPGHPRAVGARRPSAADPAGERPARRRRGRRAS